MGLFSRTTQSAGWMALNFQPEGISIAHVVRHANALPEVTQCVLSAGNASDASALEKLGKEAHISRYRCTTLLNPTEYQMLVVEAPNVPPDELKIAMRWRIKDMLDYHIDDATLDVLDIPPDKSAASRNHSMYAVAAPNQVIQKRIGLFEQSKIQLGVIDVPEMAQRNVANLVEKEGRGIAVLAFNSEGGLLTISAAGELYLSRRIEISLAQLMESSGAQQVHFFERVALELQRSFDHFDRQFHYVALSRLVLAPLPQKVLLKDYLATNLYVPVASLNLETLLDFSNTPELKQLDRQALHFHTLGAALRVEEKSL